MNPVEFGSRILTATVAYQAGLIGPDAYTNLVRSIASGASDGADPGLGQELGGLVARIVEEAIRTRGGVAEALRSVAGQEAREILVGIGDERLPGLLGEPVGPGGHVLLQTYVPASSDPDLTRAEETLRFTLTKVHGEGGLGRVWLARDTQLGREVAIKEIRADRSGDPGLWRRFLREAQITGQLQHPNIVPVYELARRPEDDQPFYVMRFVQGQTLTDAIRARKADGSGVLGVQGLLFAFIGVCQAVGYAHSKGIVHRDLKPENVMLGDFGESIVLDWGLARPIGEPAEGNDVEEGRAGTPIYMAPEQAAGRLDEIDERTDVYGLGGILFEILTGTPPVAGGSTAEVRSKVRSGEILRVRELAPGTSPALEAICRKAMAVDRAGRYASALEVAEDVRRWLADEPVSSHVEPWIARVGRWARKHRTLVASASAAGLVLLLSIAATVAGQRSRGIALVEALEASRIGEAPALVRQLGPLRIWSDSRLRADVLDESRPEDLRIRAALGALGQVEQARSLLRSKLLGSPPAQLAVIRDALLADDPRGHVAWLMDVMRDANGPGWLPAACAVSADGRWPEEFDEHRKEIAEALLAIRATDSTRAEEWVRLLGAGLRGLAPTFVSSYTRENFTRADQDFVANILASHAADVPTLTRMVTVADDKDFDRFLGAVDRSRDRQAVLDGFVSLLPHPAGLLTDAEARRRALAGVALIRLGQAEAVWPHFRHVPDPLLRSWLIDRVGPLGVPPEVLIRRWEVESDVSARRALTLAMGRLDRKAVGDLAAPFLESILRVFETHADPGMHSAAEWLVRRWGAGARLTPIIDRLRGRPIDPTRGWFVDRHGITFAIIRDPAEILMGCRPGEDGHSDACRIAPKRRKIGRNFAIATTEFTVGQAYRVDPSRTFDLITYGPISPSAMGSRLDLPVALVPWIDAVALCESLSGDGPGSPGHAFLWGFRNFTDFGITELPLNLMAPGRYRLPTDAEWEYAARAGALTRRPFGEGDGLMRAYAYSLEYEKGKDLLPTDPVGSRMPNDLGLFDVIGNLREWCLPTYDLDRDPPANDPLYESPISPLNTIFGLRGGSGLDDDHELSTSCTNWYDGRERYRTSGFRVVMTLP